MLFVHLLNVRDVTMYSIIILTYCLRLLYIFVKFRKILYLPSQLFSKPAHVYYSFNSVLF